MKEIPLTQGKVALVDDKDFDDLMQFKWQAHKTRGVFYATHAKYYLGKFLNIPMHSYLMGFPMNREVDHINGNTLDNQRSNLRLATHAQNIHNSRLSKRNKSGYKGVCWHKLTGKWIAQIGIDGKQINLGYFDDIKEAAKKYNEAAIELFGEFAYLNKI